MKRGLILKLMSVSFVSFVVSSCNYKIDKNPIGEAISVSDELKQTVSYNQVKSEVFQSKCISCHGNSGGINLESYPATIQNLDKIKKTVFKSKTMPKAPFSALDQRQMQVLMAWIEAGGPEKPIGGGDNPDPEPTTVEPTYPSIKKHVLDMKCLSCHKPGGQAASIPMVTKEDLTESSLELVVPGDPDESGIMIVLEPGARKFMPPVDSGISPLTEEEKNAIRTWIQNGAP